MITELELLGFPGISSKESEVIEKFLSECKIIGVTQDIKNQTILLRQKYKSKLPDSIIMATAIYLNLPLITADEDFKKVEELTLIHYEF